MLGKKNQIKSPCIDVCTQDEDQICIGCYRSDVEIARWSVMSDEEKKQVLSNTARRRAEKTGTDYYGSIS